jgi:large subunit ribosomal protein L25
MLSLAHDEMLHHLEHEAFYSHILTVKVGNDAQRAVLKDVQRHPAKPKILHVDFQRISETEKIHMHVPLHFIGENVAPGVKVGGGIVSHLMNSIDIVCLPKDLPEYVEVDLSNLNLNEAIHLSDLKLPSGVEIPSLAHGQDHDLPVVSIHAPRGGADLEEEAPAEAGEVPVIGEGEKPKTE